MVIFLSFSFTLSILLASSSVNSIFPTSCSSTLNTVNLNTISSFVCWLLLPPVPPDCSSSCELSGFCVVESCPGLLSPGSILLPSEELPSPSLWGGTSSVSFPWSTSPVLACTCSPFELPSPCDGWSDGLSDSPGCCSPCEGGVFSFLLISNVFVIELYLSENKFLFPSLL